MAHIWRAYQNVLHKHPFKTHTVLTGVLMGLGDVSAQLIVEKKPIKQVDLVRTGQFAAVGLFFVGPVLRTWFITLDRMFGAAGKTTAIKKLIVDQTCFAPTLLASFIGVLNVVHGGSLEQYKAKLNKDYFDILKAQYSIWPAVQICNFYFIPLQHRIMVVNGVAYFWNIYLAWKTNQSRHIGAHKSVDLESE
ncbi:hypothetical protein CHUAL_002381 [Chamberlinius hualienensis]